MNRSALVLLAVASLRGASPTAWEMTTYQDFLKGKFQGVLLHRDGRVALAPAAGKLFHSSEPAVWSIARDAGGSLYLGTGHKGRLYRVDSTGKSDLLWTAAEPEIFAVAVDRQGRLYAATSPGGKVYRIVNGKATAWFDPQARYIWALAVAADGTVFVATGDEGRIYRVMPSGQGEVYYETGQAHVTSLVLDPKGQILAGSEPNGIIYRIPAKDRAFVLHDAALPEIRALVAAPDGTVYAAAMGGSVARQSTAAAGAAPSVTSSVTAAGPVTSVTVTDQAAQAGAEVKPTPPGAQQVAQAAQTAAASPVVEQTGVEKSAILRINPDQSVESLWSSKEENVYDLALAGDSLLATTDNQGRVYRIDRDRRASMIVESQEAEALRVIVSGAETLVATASSGSLLRLGTVPGDAGMLESPVHDATAVARWGRISWRSSVPPACRLVFRTRSGNSVRPDRTWSDWSEPLADPEGSQVASPNARYVQWKAEFKGTSGATPELDWVRLAYLPQNAPPQVRSVTVSSQTAQAAKPAAQQTAVGAYSITVTDTGEVSMPAAVGTATQPVTRAAFEQIVISWTAEDTDGDKLIYTLDYRGEDERQWRALKTGFAETQHTVDAEALADGRYWFRVTASDKLSNPAGLAREAELVSAPVLVDRTPPVIEPPQGATAGAGYRWRFRVTDAASPLVRCEYSIDAGAWTPLAPEDGVIDSRVEWFELRLEERARAAGGVQVRVYDSANNAGVIRLTAR